MAAIEQPRFRIENARARHLDEVLRIERLAFPSPWSRESYEHELRHERSVFRVALVPGLGVSRIRGFICSWYVVDECHILKIAVEETFRRDGIASGLLIDTLTTLKANGARMAYLEVRPSNGSGIAFYESHGFKPIGHRPNYYSDTGEDALLYFRALS